MDKLLSDDYDDEYETCERTYATLRIYPENIHPDEISRILNITPSKYQVKGDHGENFPSPVLKRAPVNGWFLTSKNEINSRDVRRHIDYIISKVFNKKDEILRLQSEDVEFDIFCYWASSQGQGGPTLSPKQMKVLTELNIEIGFDIY